MWYMHDGASDFPGVVCNYLQVVSSKRWIDRSGHQEWTLISPELNSLHFCGSASMLIKSVQ